MTKKASIKWLDDDSLHIETELGIINIQFGFTTDEGKKEEIIEILADGDRYKGELPVWLNGKPKQIASYNAFIQEKQP